MGEIAVMAPDHGLTSSPRRTFWNPVLDERTAKDYTAGDPGPLLAEGPFGVVNLVSSLCEDDLHRIAIDVDHDGVGALIDCETDVKTAIRRTLRDEYWPFMVWQRSARHWHLYVPNIAWTAHRYFELLDRLTDMEVIEDKYRDHSVTRGQTLLRLPSTPKVAS